MGGLGSFGCTDGCVGRMPVGCKIGVSKVVDLGMRRGVLQGGWMEEGEIGARGMYGHAGGGREGDEAGVDGTRCGSGHV